MNSSKDYFLHPAGIIRKHNRKLRMKNSISKHCSNIRGETDNRTTRFDKTSERRRTFARAKTGFNLNDQLKKNYNFSRRETFITSNSGEKKRLSFCPS